MPSRRAKTRLCFVSSTEQTTPSPIAAAPTLTCVRACVRIQCWRGSQRGRGRARWTKTPSTTTVRMHAQMHAGVRAHAHSHLPARDVDRREVLAHLHDLQKDDKKNIKERNEQPWTLPHCPMTQCVRLPAYVVRPMSWSRYLMAHVLWPMSSGPCPMSSSMPARDRASHTCASSRPSSASRGTSNEPMRASMRACVRACSGCMGVGVCLLGHEVGRVRH